MVIIVGAFIVGWIAARIATRWLARRRAGRAPADAVSADWLHAAHRMK